MFLHITTGTVSYMKQLNEEHPELLLNAMGQDGILYYEDDNDTSIFNSDRTYQIMDSKGGMSQDYPIVVFTIPIPSGSDLLISHLKDLHGELSEVNGLIAHRIGKSTSKESYVVMTHWASKEAFWDFKDTDVYTDFLSTDTLRRFRTLESLFHDYISQKKYLTLDENVEEDDEDEKEDY